MHYKREDELNKIAEDVVRQLEPTKTNPVTVVVAKYAKWGGREYELANVILAKKVLWQSYTLSPTGRQELRGRTVTVADLSTQCQFKEITEQFKPELDEVTKQIHALQQQRNDIRHKRQQAYERLIEDQFNRS